MGGLLYALWVQPVTAPTLFDQPTPSEARHDAITRADDHANPEWREQAFTALTKVARMRLTFTADDVWDELAGADETTHNPSALGPVFLRASKAGLICKTGELRLSRQTQRHRDLTVWRRAS